MANLFYTNEKRQIGPLLLAVNLFYTKVIRYTLSYVIFFADVVIILKRPLGKKRVPRIRLF